MRYATVSMAVPALACPTVHVTAKAQLAVTSK
jgi:hypothetical protein